MRWIAMLALLNCILMSNMLSALAGGIIIQGTRIIFHFNAKSVSVQLQNQFDMPALVQVWIDTGDMYQIPDASQIPFILTPALTRIEANSGQVIRIIPLGTPQLAQDRESLFIFNLLDIAPEKIEDINTNQLSFNVRTRIKLFYRPNQLNISQEKAFQLLKFKYNAKQQTLEVDNPTPYYMNISRLILNPQQHNKHIVQALMVQPFNKSKFTDIRLETQINQIKYFLINDLGGETTYTTAVSLSAD
ncbi:fimbrial chaperone protein/chaperone protein EcpD [Acinetobacter calcoaceticus]|uniref:Fimbrial chaperone protein/chaperone protein EcpD n=1 Tax=Acinetobacter calcoaceticus TaxID=471 RepID=A0A4R1XC03_ACICA|nr:fimbrial chaperone protein/chaperone protein EcpD [Acinetobacter calcoaceticus]